VFITEIKSINFDLASAVMYQWS